MSTEFDPYRTWLGIPRDEQPPNHYRLLGLALGEDDLSVIENAVDQRVMFIRTFQHGKYSDQSQEVLNRLSAARICLLDPAKKRPYDEELLQKERESKGVAPPVPPPQVDPDLAYDIPPLPAESGPPNRGLEIVLASAIAGVLLAAVVVGVWLSFGLPTEAIAEKPAAAPGPSNRPRDPDPAPVPTSPVIRTEEPIPKESPTKVAARIESASQSPIPAKPATEQWRGKLQRVCRFRGEVHLLVVVNEKKRVEAVAADPAFYDQISDFHDADIDRDADQVVVAGRPAAGLAPKFRLDPDSDVVTLESIERDGVPESHARVGQTRLAQNLDPGRQRHAFRELQRDLPAAGQVRRVAGYFDAFDSPNVKVTSTGPDLDESPEGREEGSPRGTAEGVEPALFFSVRLPGPSAADFRDYRRGDKVELELKLRERDASFDPSRIEWNCASIQRPSNPASRVTPRGRDEPALREVDWESSGIEAVQEGKEFRVTARFDKAYDDKGMFFIRLAPLLSNSTPKGISLIVLGDAAESQPLKRFNQGDEVMVAFRLLSLTGGEVKPVVRWIARCDDLAGSRVDLLRDAPLPNVLALRLLNSGGMKRDRDKASDEIKRAMSGDWEMTTDQGTLKVNITHAQVNAQWVTRTDRIPRKGNYVVKPEEQSIESEGLRFTWLEDRFLICSGAVLVKNQSVSVQGVLRRLAR